MKIMLYESLAKILGIWLVLGAVANVGTPACHFNQYDSQP